MTGEAKDRVTIFSDLLDRRVPQILGLYLGASWGILQFLQYIVERYSLSPHLEDVSLVVLFSLVPSVTVVVYYHGKGEWDRWSKVEVLGIPTNLLITGFLLFAVLQNKSFANVTTKVVVQDEDGQRIERTVAKNQFRQQIALFHFKNSDADSGLDWVSSALPLAMSYDLYQDLFLTLFSSYSSGPLANRIKKAGFDVPGTLPLPLCRKFAEEVFSTHFVTGSFTLKDGSYTVHALLYHTKSGKVVTEHELTGSDLLELVDEYTLLLKKDLKLPEVHLKEAVDLPLHDTLTTSPAALEALTLGIAMEGYENEPARVRGHLEKAIELDPTFAYGWFQLTTFYLNQGLGEETKKALANAEKFDYKLPENLKFYLKEMRYHLYGQTDKLLDLLKMRVAINPSDGGARFRLANAYRIGKKHEEALEQYLEGLKLSPEPFSQYHDIGWLYRTLGRNQEALPYFEKYAEEFPDKEESFFQLAAVHVADGNFPRARENFEKVLLLDSADMRAQLGLAKVDMSTGNMERALATCLTLLEERTDPDERETLLGILQEYYLARGQPKKALAYFERKEAEAMQNHNPVRLFFTRINGVYLYAKAGRGDEAPALLEKWRAEVGTTFGRFAPFGFIYHYLALEDGKGAATILASIEDEIESMRYTYNGVYNFVLYSRAWIHELNQDWPKALEYFREYGKVNPDSDSLPLDLGRCLRKTGQFEEAESQLEKALKQVPYNGEAHYQMALVLAATDRRQQAIEHLRQALATWSEAEPDFKPAQEARAALLEMQGATKTGL